MLVFTNPVKSGDETTFVVRLLAPRPHGTVEVFCLQREMGERKVLNKYYPPDFDPAKLPKLSIPGDRQYVVRLMAPFTMRCKTCGNYVYKGKKFNARKEDADGEKYLGIQIYRFYIRCPQCLSEITFKTDPENTDYVVEHGAYRTFQAERLAELEEERVQQDKEEEEANNPMLALENRTKESRREMDVIDALEEIRDWNTRNAQVKFEDLMEHHIKTEKLEAEAVDRAEQALASEAFNKQKTLVRRLADNEEEGKPPPTKKVKPTPPTTSSKHLLSGLIKRKVTETKFTDKAGSTTVGSPPTAGSEAGTAIAENSLKLIADYSDSSDSD